ncbi:KN motif and ankyrin repeat domain-containing protein 2 [Acyrthosiphon pisum]|uniref:KN motif and ankyrin repeat domain-containing protein 2 n=1 Tax=Acyrthosiphon pisum TaxID=7029 RepID=A0A8R1VYP6_ACYPI|nr:KN motif and ankyrin repeat domain-containing protein 2 [Acyrthosiphon pisum]|eukprot:XP_001942619.2 PREDICTED: KN motif and ankyrin repeat domain-containing protein 2 [Acyrthosiphon pisum]
MYSARNRNAMITDDTFQIQDWLRSNGNHDRGYPEFDYHHRIRPLSPVKRHRISTITDGRVPDRRRQLKSMESLLGLSDENLNGKYLNSEAVTRASPDVQDSLDRALMDFEETLELAFQSNSIVPPPRGFSNQNLVEGDESNFNKLDSSFESNTTTGSSGYSTKPDQSMHRSLNTYNELQLIREQMVKSLEIIKDLEEQVKLVPMLKAQVSSLNLEKQRLSSELEKHKTFENTNKYATVGSGWSLSASPANRRVAVSTKEVGINCVPMCRDVGVTTPSATSVNTSTMTERPPSGAAVHTQTDAATKTATIATHTQTKDVVKPATSVAHTQTTAVTDVQPATVVAAEVIAVTATTTANVGTQSSRPAAVRTTTVGVTARPRTYDASVAAKPTLKHVGCSADVSTDAKPAAAPVTRATQTDARDDRSGHNRTTQTEAAAVPEIAAIRANPTEVASTLAHPTGSAVARPNYATIGRRSNSFHHYTAGGASDTTTSSVTSKIPRLKPVTPEFNRKVLTRQDTYTKTAAEICTDDLQQQPSLSLSPPPPLRVTDDVSRSKESMSSTPELQNGLPESDMNFQPIQDELYKDSPSKEMKGALKVLNDSLKKTSATLLPRTQLKQAIDIVREEWFKVTSSSNCGGQLVKNYVNWFTSYSPVLLEFIINMTDAAGNTVLHYSISHGNFDVVSTILDTGVCNVNLTNDAGYSSVMLVSLADIKNDDEMKIITRLFKCGDVNLQAKKHGQTTLMLAVSHGKSEVVKLLLECGANLNMQDEDGSTALMCAAEHGLQDIVNILLACPECDVSIADNDGSTALSIAMEAGHKEIGIALYAKQHILSRENSPFNLSKSKRSRSANTVMPSNNMTYSHLSLKKSPSLQPKEYATLSSMLKTRIP